MQTIILAALSLGLLASISLANDAESMPTLT